MERSPFYQAALRVAHELVATACSIYEHVNTARTRALLDHQESGDKLILLSTTADGKNLRGQPPDFDTTIDKNLSGTTWAGFTSFVARWNVPINAKSVSDSVLVELSDGQKYTVTKAGLWSEVDPLGPLLAAPIELSGKVAGVVRVVRHDGANEFNAHDVQRLSDFAKLIAMLLLEARTARDLIAKIHELKSFDFAYSAGIAADAAADSSMPRRDSLLEGIAAAARELLRAPDRGVAVFMRNSSNEYVLRAPLEIYENARRSGKSKYELNDNGVTPQVWRDYGDGPITQRLGGPPPRRILSHDLDKDVDAGSHPPGRFAHTKHVPGEAETPGVSTKSFIAVPILSSNHPTRVEGVIRATSGQLSAFSYSDVVTLEALAEAAGRLLVQRRAARDKEQPLQELMKTIEHGVVVVAKDETVLDLNPAASAFLGRDAELRGKPIVDVLFHGRVPLERALNDAIAAGMARASTVTPALSGYITSFFRASPLGAVPVPVRVRASKLVDEHGDGNVDTIITFEPLRTYSKVVTIGNRPDGKPSWRTADPLVAKEFEKCQRIGPNASVLILGETGVGKNLLARSVHDMSPRRSKTFVAENCAEHRPELAAGELFGTKPGAFTGAIERQGRIAAADGGTVFLDEIAELPLTVQATLLKLIDEKTFKAIGGTEPNKLDVRFVAATNADLEDLIKRGAFRADLYHRLRGTVLKLPPLRSRVDVLLLADECLQDTWNERSGTKSWNGQMPAGFDGEVIEFFLAHNWPGNFRDLLSVVRSGVETFQASSSSGVIKAHHLPVDFVEQASQAVQAQRGSSTRQDNVATATLVQRVAELEDAVKEVRALAKGPVGAASVDLFSTQALLSVLRENPKLMQDFLSEGPASAAAEEECRRVVRAYLLGKGKEHPPTITYAIKAARQHLVKELKEREVSSTSPPRRSKSSTKRTARGTVPRV